jgi:hypothetical protein
MGKQGIVCSVCLVAVLAGRPPAFGEEARFPTLGGHPLIPIRWTAGCGTDALYLCLELSGVKVSYAEFVTKSGLTSPREPIDVARLWQLARDCGGHAQAIRVRNGPDVLRKIMQDVSVRTAIVHLKAVERNGKREEEHFSTVLLIKDTLRIVGEDSYERDAAQEWKARWSGVALLVSAKPIVLAGPEGAPQPQVFISPSEFDCGRVFAGSKVPYQFIVENRGDGDLEITDVRSDCSCSTPTIGERLIRPRQSTTLEGYVDAGPVTGRRAVHVTVFATDPERPQVQVDVVLNVTPLAIKLSESKVVMSTRSRRERPKSTLVVDYTDPDAAIRVARLEPSADWLRAELSLDARQILLSADPLDSAKSRTATLTLHTADPEAALKVPVEVRLIELVECHPAQLYLDRKSERGDVIRRTIELRPQPEVPFADVKAEVRGVPGSVKRIRHVEEKGVWEVEVEFGPLSGQTAMTVGVVEISVAPDADADKIQVPVYVR